MLEFSLKSNNVKLYQLFYTVFLINCLQYLTFPIHLYSKLLLVTEKEKLRFYSAIGENIRKARENAGLKQAAFAIMLGLSRASIVNIEKGRQHPPLHLLWDITKKLKVNLLDLLANIEAKKRSQSEIKLIEKQISELLKDESESSKEKVAQFITENING